jgi:GDP-fucose transporter C1
MSSREDDIPMSRKDRDESEEPFLPAPVQSKPERQHPTTLIAAVVGFYFAISLSVVFLNKIILSGSSDFPYALFVTWYQLLVALVLLLIWAQLGKRFVINKEA